MAKFNNDYLNRLLGVDQVNPSSGLTDPEVRKALEGYEKPNSTYREKFGDAGQGRAYTSTHKDAIVYRGNDYNYIDEKNKSQGTLAPTTLNPFSSESYYNWNMRLGVLGNLALSTGVKAAQGIGFVAGGLADLTESAGVGIYNAFSKEDMERQGNIFTRVADNGINQALDSLDPVVKDLFPVFKANNYEDKNFGQKALTSEFWSTDAVDGLAFAASAYLTGSAMTKGLQVGAKSAKLLGIGNRALRLAQAGSKTALPNVQRYIAATDFTTNVLANTAIESMFEAKDVRDAILSDPALAMKYSPEEIQQIAAEKARDVFGLNMLFVAPSNMFELFSLTAKGLKGASRATRKADKLVGMNAMGEYSKINPLWYQKPTAQIGKAILGNAASEGLYEENIQYNIQNLSKLNAHRGPGSSFGEAVGNMFTGLGDLATDITKEQATSIGLGGLIGGGMQMSHISPAVNKALGGDGGIIQNYRDKLKNRDKLYESLTSTATSASGLDIFEREAPTNYTLTKEQDENGELVSYMQKEGGEKRKIAEFTWKALATNAGLDLEKGGTAKMALPLLEADGSPKVDLGKLESMYIKVKRREELNNVYEALSASPEKNKYSLDIVKSAMIADLAMAHFDAGLGQQLYQKLDSLLQANPESLELIGTSAISSPMELQKLKDYVTNLEELYNGLEVGVVNSVATPKQQQERKQVMFDRAARVLAIDNLTGELTKEIQSQIRELQTTRPEMFAMFEKEMQESFNTLSDFSIEQQTFIKRFSVEGAFKDRNNQRWIDKIDAFMDVLSNSSVTKNDPNYLAVSNNLAKLAELNQSRSDLYEEWKNLSNLYKGEKYYLDNFDGISKKYDYITPTIDVNNTTLKQYLDWERTQLPIVQLRSKLHANNSDYLNRMIKDLLAKGESLVHVVDWAIANEVALSKYHVDMILEELEEFQDSLIALKEEQDDIAKQIRDAELNDASDDVLDELDAKLANVKTQLNEARAALGSYFNMDPTELGKILTDLRKRNTFENFQIKDYIEELGKQHLGYVEATLAAFNNNDSFDDLASVESAIVTVQSLLNIFTKRKDAKAFTKFAGELQELLDELEKALEVVTDRHLNKFRKEYNRVNSLADGIVEVLADPDVKELLPNVGEVMSLLETDKLTRTENEQTKEERVRRPISFNLFAILTALNNNRDLAAFVQSKVNALVTEFLDTNKNYDFYKQNPKFRAFVDSFEEAIRVNPVRAIKGFLLEESGRGGTMGTYSYDKGPDSSLATYLAEGDVGAMIASLQGTEVRPESSALSNAQLLEIAQMLKQLEVLELVKSVAQSEQSPAIFLNTFEKELKGHEAAFKADKSFTPAASIVQSLAIFQIYDALFKALGSTATERFSNWTYFKGPGGAGKTNVVVRYAVKALGINPKQIVTAGHNKHSAEGIQSSIGNEKTFAKEDLITQLSNKTLLEGTKLLIIDEIGGFSQQEIEDIASLVQANYPTVPLIVMGDPNQVTASLRESVAVEKGFTSTKDSILQGIYNIIDVTPLFTRFRSDNPAIVNLQDSFLKRKEEFTGGVGVANVDASQITSTDTPIIGTYIDSTTGNLLPILFNSYSKNPNRTRAVIVATPEQQISYKAQIEKSFPNSTIEVLTYIESQGRTIDEVYVHIPFDKGVFPSIIEHSQAMYTATSRGKQFVYLSGVKGASNKVDIQLAEKANSIKKQKDDNFTSILEYISSAQTILKGLNISVVDATPETKKEEEREFEEDTTVAKDKTLEEILEQELTDEEKQEIRDDRGEDNTPESLRDEESDAAKVNAQRYDEVEEIDEDVPETDQLLNSHTEKTIKDEVEETTPITPENTSSESISLLEPSSDVFNPITINYKGQIRTVFQGLNALIKGNTPTDVHLMRTTTVDGVDQVVMAVRPDANENIFVTIAVLSKEELGSYDTSSLPLVVRTGLEHNVFEVNKLPANFSSLYKLDLANTKPLKYRYERIRSKFDALEVFRKWVKSFFWDTAKLGNEGELKRNLRVVVPTSPELESGGKYASLGASQLVQAGKPFLLLRGGVIKRTTASGSTISRQMKDQAIMLTPRFLNVKNKVHFSRYIEPIQNYIKHVRELETIIAKHLIDPSLAATYKLGSHEFAMLVAHLSNIEAMLTLPDYSLGKETTLSESDQNYGYLFKLFKLSSFTSPNSPLLAAALAVDQDIHGKWEDRIKMKLKASDKSKDKQKVASYERNNIGPAQQAFDKIARANLWMNVGSKAIVLRDSRPATFVDAKGKLDKKDVVGGRTLLGWVSSDPTKVKPNYTGVIQGYLRQASERSKAKGFDIDFNVNRNLDNITGRKVMNIEELEAIFGDAAFNEKGEHSGKKGSGLRIPISRRLFQKKTVAELEKDGVFLSDYFDDTFVRVEPNRVSVFPAQGSSTATVPDAPVVQPVVPERKYEDQTFDDLVGFSEVPSFPQLPQRYAQFLGQNQQVDFVLQNHLASPVDIVAKLKTFKSKRELDDYFANGTDTIKVDYRELGNILFYLNKLRANADTIATFSELTKYSAATAKLRRDSNIYFALPNAAPIYEGRPNVNAVFVNGPDVAVVKWRATNMKEVLYTARHELIHSVIYDIMRYDRKKFLSLANQIRNSKEFNAPIARHGGRSIRQILETGQYKNKSAENKDNEALTIFFTEIAAGNLKLAAATENKVVKWLRSLLSSVGLEWLLFNPSADIYTLAEGIAVAFAQGTPLRSLGIKPTEHLDFAEAPIEPVEMTQLAQLYRQLNPMTMKQVFKAWLSGKSARNAAEADMFTVVNGAHLEHVYGKKAFGLFKAGSIAIEQGLNEVKAKEVLQHEIFHKIFHRFLNQEERAVLIADAKAKYTYLQGATDLEIEHFLIEVFNSYVYKPTDLFGRLALFFDKLLFRIGLFNRSANTIDTFFKRLYSGYYTGDGKYEFQSTIADDKLQKYFAGSLKLYENAKALTLGFIRRKYSYDAIESKLSGEQLYTNPPLTFDEAVASLEAEFKFQMKAWLHQNPNTPLDERVVVFDLLANNKAARDEIIRSLFPDIKITRDNKKKGTGGKPDELLELEDEEAEIENNKIDFGKNQEEIDQQRNVIRNVKQVLSTLQYRDKNDKLQYVPFPTAYAILIKLLNGLSTEGTIEDQVKFVSRRLTDIGRTPESLAVLAFVTDVINGLYIEDAGKANFIQFNGDDKVTIDTANRTYSATKAKGEDQQTFLTRVYEETKDLGFTQKEIYEGYKLYRYRNMYALLGSSIRSLRKQVNFYGVREKIKGNYIYKYFAGRESGSQASLIAIIQGQILAKYKKDANVFTASQWKMFTTERIRTRTEAEDKRVKQVISQYLTTLGYNPRIRLQELIENNTIVQEDLNTLYDAIVYFNKRLQAAIDPKSNTDVEEFVLTEEATFFRTIQEALQFSDPDFQSSSSIRGDGKRIYPYVNGSYGLDVLNYFVKLGKHVGAHWTPKFMRTNFYQNNLFVNGFLTMKSVVDHDSIKYKGLDNTAKLFNKETALDWFARNFLYGFVGALEVGSEGSLSYFQFLDTPSNKPKTQAVDVEIINMNKANAALDLMRYQETTRDKHAVQQYSPDQSYVATGEEMQKGVDTFLQQLINNNVLSLMNLDTIYKKLNKVVQRPDVKVETRAKEILEKLKEKSQRLESFLSSTQATEELSEEEVKVIQEVTDKIQEEALELLEMSDIETLLAYYRPISELYYYNYYVNSHQLRQLVIGDPAFYKNGSEAYDIIKRMSIALAPGKVGVVNERLGFMKSKIRVGVSKDAEKFINNPEIQGLLDKYDATDAQGFVTPDFARRVKRSYGFEEALDVTMKPVHFEIDENGIPRALKFSTIELTDELVGKFPALKVLRDAMEASNIDIATFKSAVKVGVPAKLAENNHPEYEVTSAYEEDNIFELRAENFRIQLNPAHDAIAFTANPSQLSYQGIINEGNLSQLMRINELNAKIIAIGSKQLGKIFQLRGNTPTSKTRDVTRGLAMSSWFDMPGFEGLWRLVNNKNIDLNMPILQKSIERLIASKWSRGSVGFKFLGSKLVLQADYGVSHIIDKDGKTVKASPLVWKDDQSYTEVYVPQAWAERYGVGVDDEFSIDDKIIAFRLPSTGLHSALVMKIKGFYPTPEGAKANVVIAPKEIVNKHGSDYDVDSLFVLLKKRVSEYTDTDERDQFNLGAVLRMIDPNAPELVLNGKDVIGYLNGKRIKIDGVPFIDALDIYVQRMDDQLKTIFSKNRALWTEAEVEKVDLYNGEYGKGGIYHQLTGFMQEVIKNEIVDTFEAMLTNAENDYWMNLPITMERLKGVSEGEASKAALDVVAEMRGLEVQPKHQELYEKVDLSNINDQQKMHYNSYSGAALVGVSANSYKDVAHIFMAAPTTSWIDINTNEVYTKEQLDEISTSEPTALALLRDQGKYLMPKTKEAPKVKENLAISFNGHIWGELSHTEKELVTDEEGNKVLVNKAVKLGPNEEGEYSTKTYTVWETFDSLINASIDNVKEQIVYLLNLTGQTANEYFAMLSLGIPMDSVVRFMNSPVLYELATQGTLNSGNLSKLRDNFIKQIAKIEGVNVKDKETLKAFTKSVLNREVNLTDESLVQASNTYWANGKQLNSLSIDEMLMQIKVVQEFSKLTEIGSSLFDLSRVLNVLRVLPGTYWEQKETLEALYTKISDFGQEEVTTALKRQDAKTEETREKFEEARSRNNLLSLIAEQDLSTQEKIRRAQSSIMSSVLNTTANKVTKAVKDWPFVNSAILSIPNVQQGAKVLQRLVDMQEKMFFRHSPAMNKFIEEVAKELDLSGFMFRRKWKAYEKFKTDFMHFFLSGITLEFNNQSYNVAVDPSTIRIDPKDKKNKFGFKAWSATLIDDLRELRTLYPNNPFLNAIEFGYNKEEKVTTIVFTSDKSKTPMESLIYKFGFDQLNNEQIRAWEADRNINRNPDTEFTNIQLRLFHYMLVTQGTEFGRTSFSGVIPDRMYEEYSRVFNKHMAVTLDRNGESELLGRLKEQFMLQFVTNNIDLLTPVKGDDPRLAKDLNYEDFPMHFGLALKHDSTAEYDAKEYVSHYGDAYIFIGNYNDHDLYQKVSYKSGVKYYSFPENLIDSTFDTAAVFNGTLILPKEQGYDRTTGVYTTLPNPKQIPTEGEEVYLHSTSDVSYTQTEVYEITDVSFTESANKKGEAERVYKYKLRYDRFLDTTVQPEDENTSASRIVTTWGRSNPNGYEVSSRGDSRFSALYARFKANTIVEGVNVGGRTIEDVYQSVIKRSGKNRPPAQDSILYKEGLRGAEAEDYSYFRGYKPLWQEWASQNPELIEELTLTLIQQGKTTLTDQFAGTRVSQARALSDIINSNEIETPEISEAPSVEEMGNKLEAVNEELKEAIAKGVGEDGVIRKSLDKAPKLIARINATLLDKGIALDTINNVYTSFDRTYKRLTEWTREIFKDSYEKDIFTYRAERDFEKKGLKFDEIYMDTSGKVPIPYTFEERVVFHQATINSAAAAGRVVHAYMEYIAEKDQTIKAALGRKIAELSRAKKDDKGNVTQKAITPYIVKWLTPEVIGSIFYKAGININLKSNVKTADQDTLLTELMAYSDALGYGTQVDGLVVHSDGDLSIVDWKTGKLFSDEFTNKVFKYGNGLPASKVNTAKLEVVLRAFALKEMLGSDAKFRKLSLGLITKAKGVQMVDIEIKDFLPIVEAYVKATNPTKHAELKQKGMFDAKQYLADSASLVQFKSDVEAMDPIHQKDYLEKKLRSLSLAYSEEELRNNKDLREQYNELSRIRLQLEGRDDLSYNDEDQDIKKYERYFYNVKDMPSKFIKAFGKILFARGEDKTKEYNKYESDFNAFLNPVLKEYFESKPSLAILNKISRGTVNFLPFVGALNKTELFAFMWAKQDANGYHGHFANLMDFYINAEGQQVPLTQAQKAFRDYYHDSMRKKYKSVVGKQIVNRNNKETTLGQEQGYDPNLDGIFMPRVHKSLSDVVETGTVLEAGMKGLKKVVADSMAAIVEDPYTGDQTGIPIRYLHANDSVVIQDELHSMDVERAWKAFMKDLVNKDHMEDVYALAKGLKTFYATSTDRKGNPMMPKMTAFMEDVIFAHILERMPEERLTGKRFLFTINEKQANSYIGKMLDLKPGTGVNLPYEQIMYSMKRWTSAVGMWLKPIQGGLNGMLIFGTNFSRAMSNSVSAAFGTDVEFTLMDWWQAHYDVWIKPAPNLVTGKLSKVHHVARNMKFMTDNYDYENLNSDLLTAKNTLFSTSTLVGFHSMFESYGQYILMVAMMRKQKVQTPDGEKSMWELYDDNGVYRGPVRGVVVDKLGNKRELTELDSTEIQKMKRVSEKLHGSYRKDERVMAELTLWGQMLMQFKKYLPGLIKNNWRGTYDDMYLGKYVIKTDENGVPIRPDGVDQYEWEEMQVTGRWPLLLKFFMQTFSKAGVYNNKEFTWQNLSSQQKTDVIAGLLIPFQAMALSSIALLFIGGFDDDEEVKNKTWYKRIMRLQEDYTLGLDPRDLIRPITENPLPSGSKALELMDAIAEFLTDGLMGETDSRGLPEGAYDIYKNTPVGSWIHAWNTFMKDFEPEAKKLTRTER